MTQPIGFVDKDHPSHVCKLYKVMYGFKQDPRAWYNELQQFLHNMGFSNSHARHLLETGLSENLM